jgi:hemin uptake protein HemP
MAIDLSAGNATRAQESRPAQGTPESRSARRLQSRDLFQQGREVEIDHEGRIYRLRLTQLNKLILTA